MATVTLHVYDIANTDNDNLNSFLKFVNNVSREVRAGGIYHGATASLVFCDHMLLGRLLWMSHTFMISMHSLKMHHRQRGWPHQPAAECTCFAANILAAAGAIEVYGYEWSFGYCPSGSGVYKMKPRENKMYTFRESLPLGETPLSRTQFHSVLKQLQAEYQGCTYDLLTRNCCHFCEELSERLSSEPIPGMS